MKLVIMAIGVPGAGKTTTFAPIVGKYGIERISRDEIREEWFGKTHLEIQKETTWEERFGDSEVQAQKEAVKREAELRTQHALEQNSTVLLDSTFGERSKRLDAISTARKAGAERVVGVFFTVPLEVAKERNAGREYPVQESIIEKIYTHLNEEPPLFSEGFDALYMIDELEKFEEVELQPLA